MAYGKIKADAFIYDDGGDQEITTATIASNSNKAPTASPTFTGTVTLPGTVQVGGQATDVTIADNNANALEIKQGSNKYVTFDTTNSAERVEVDQLVVASEHITLNAQKELRLADSDSSHHIAIKAPATLSSNVNLTMPANDGDADQVLTTNGSGTLTWAAPSGGKILQVVPGTVIDSSSSFSSNSTWTDSGVEVTITPTSSTSKIYITGITSWGVANGGYSLQLGLWRGSTQIDMGTGSATNRGRYIMSYTSYGQYPFYLYPITMVDSPNTTSATTYKVRVYNQSSVVAYLNRHLASDNYHTASKLIAWEIDNS